MTDKSVSRFREQVIQVGNQAGLDYEDPFAVFYASEVNQITRMMLEATEEADIGKFDRLIVAWLDRFGEKSYQHLAYTINAGFSHESGRMEKRAVAVAEHEAFMALKSWRDYGIFEMPKTAVQP